MLLLLSVPFANVDAIAYVCKAHSWYSALLLRRPAEAAFRAPS